jgi:hypothetical protein
LNILDVHHPLTLARPNQRYDPPNHAPSEKQIDEKNGELIVPCTQQGDDRGQEVKDKPKSKERKEKREKEESKYVHSTS